MQFLVGGTSYQFKLAGMDGYRQGRQAFEQNENDESLVVDCSVRKLFRMANLARNGRSTGRLRATLDRLTKPIAGFSSVLEKWEGKDGHLRFSVRRDWVPSSHFGRVPLPLPTNGATLLALYLFLYGTDHRGQTSIRTEVLYKRLGIPLSRPMHAQRALDSALKLANRHLVYLNNRDLLNEHDLPSAFQIEPLGNGKYLHFAPNRDQSRSADGLTIKRPHPATSGWEDEGASLEAADLDRDNFRRSVLNDEALDDDDIDELGRRQNFRRSQDQERERLENDRVMFANFNARLKSSSS